MKKRESSYYGMICCHCGTQQATMKLVEGENVRCYNCGKEIMAVDHVNKMIDGHEKARAKEERKKAAQIRRMRKKAGKVKKSKFEC